MMSALLRIGFASCLALSLVVAVVGSALAQSEGGISVRPANPDPAVPISQSYFVMSLAAGATKSDELLVLNTGSAPITLDLYAVDALTGSTTGAVYAARTATQTGAGGWIRVAEARVTVPPGSTARVPFDVVVPTGARSGQYLAGLVAQAIPGPTPVAAAPAGLKEGQFTVETITRAVVAVAITVPGPLERKLTITGVGSRPGSTGAQLAVGVRNDGNVLLKPHGQLTLRDSAGAQMATLPLDMDTILPGGSAEFVVTWPADLTPGQYSADVTLDTIDALPTPATASGASASTAAGDSGPAHAALIAHRVAVMPATVERTISGVVGTPGTFAVRREEGGWPGWAPFLAAGVVVLVIGNGALAYVLVRRRRR